MAEYTLKNNLLEITVSTYGATLTSVKYKGEQQILRYSTVQEYAEDEYYIGATVGRCANRIGNSVVDIEGERYELIPNEGKNHLHGGPDSFSKREWEVDRADERVIRLYIDSPDGDEGYPGNLRLMVTFLLSGHTLHIDFRGTTDKTTVFAPTIHPYFRAVNPKLQINARSHVEVDEELIPTGRLVKCEGRYDYSAMSPVKSDLDDCFVLNDEYGLTFESGNVTMEMWTDFPAVHIYTGSNLGGCFVPGEGIAIEAEFYPDSANHPEWPSTLLHPGETFRKYVEYKIY